MSNITNTDAVVTESKLTEFYEDIKPFLGCPAYLTSEGTSDYYSTEEKVIGRWTDGKPLYQKTVAITVPTTTAGTLAVNEYLLNINIDNCISIEGYFKSPTSPFSFNTFNRPLFGGYMTNAFIKENNKLIIENSSSSAGGRDGYVTLRYTKTTDNASTTIQEDPNEYSTDERIVGKWIDGKPIYQKVIHFDTPISIPNYGDAGVTITSITNLKRIIKADYNRDGGMYISPYGLNFWIENTNVIKCSKNPFTNIYTGATIDYRYSDFILQYTKTTD